MSTNLVAIVTGGSSGIGRAVVQRYVRKGYGVAVVDLNKPEEPEENVLYFQASVADQEGTKQVVKQIVDALGRVDILVNCAGIGITSPSLEFSDQDISKVLDVNLKGTIFMCQAVAPNMIDNGGGAIVNIASMLAHYGSRHGLAYATSKAGVMMATKCLAVEWAPYNIRVNSVSPGHIETGMTKSFIKTPGFYEYLLGRTPQHRLGLPEEIAAAIDFLASADASHITGIDLPVDGGLLAGDPSLSSKSYRK
jgi:2-deoxy-D-gluconate 3-dehydrogenase